MRSLALAASLLVAIVAVATAAIVLAGLARLTSVSATGAPLFLIIDEDSIDNGTSTIEDISFNSPRCGSTDPAVCVNDDIVRDAGNGLTTPLFSRGTDVTPFSGLVLPTGQRQDEGLFSVGLSASDLESFILDTLPNSRLDPIPGTPLREAELRALEGQVVCAKVKDSDVSDLGGGQLNAQGDYMGLTAFRVIEVLGPGSLPESGSSSSLPDLRVDLLPSSQVLPTCLGTKEVPSPTPTDTPTPPPTKTPTPTPTNTPPEEPTVTPTVTPKRLIGDVNCLRPKPGDEHQVNSIDAALILQLEAGLIDSVQCPKNADVHRDGRIDSLDALLILQFEAGLIHRLPPLA